MPMHRLLATALAVALAATSAGCGEADAPPAATSPTAAAQDADGARQLDPAQFARAAADPAVTTIDVHVPYQGEIAGTEDFVPYTRIGAAHLPSDRTTPIALYCRSGRMSAIAARQLRREGYTDLVELHGGMRAWTASGRALVHRPGRPSA
jgi:rhodanese-related sulfurtransferase